MLRASRRNSPKEPNLHHFVMDIAWFGLALATTTRFLSVYAIHLGASASQLAWMTSLPALVLLFAATFGSRWRALYPDSRLAVFWPAFGFRISFFLLALTPLLPSDIQAIWLIATLSLTAIPQGIAGVIFLGLMRESVTQDRWTTLNSQRHMAMNATIAIGVLAVGIWLERVVFPLNYQVMFLVAFVATLVSLWHVTRVKPLYTAPPTRTSLFDQSLWRSDHLRQMVFMVVLTHVPFFMVYPLVPLHLVDGLGAGESFIALFGLLELIGGVFIAGFAARLMQRWGQRTTMAVAMMGTGIAVAVIAVVPVLSLTLPAAFILGGSWTLVGIGIMGVMAEGTRPEQAGGHNMVFMQCVGLSTFLGPLIGNVLIGAHLDLIVVLLIGAMGRIVAGWLIAAYRSQVTTDSQISVSRSGKV